MEFGTRMLGALVVTYVLSRLLLLVLGVKSKRGLASVLGAHLLCFAVIAAVMGFIRGEWVSFDWTAAEPYILPQIVWLALDIARRR
jgi:hypothetical protein